MIYPDYSWVTWREEDMYISGTKCEGLEELGQMILA
jgi:hypothetical protein